MEKVNKLIEANNNFKTGGLKTAKGMEFRPTEYQVDNSASRGWAQLSKFAEWASNYKKPEEEDLSARLREQYGPELAKMFREGRIPMQLNETTIRGIKFRQGQEDSARLKAQYKQMISAGKFNNWSDAEKSYHEARVEQRKATALSYGWSADDVDFLDGYARTNDRDGMELTDHYLQWESQKTESIQQLQVSQLQDRVFSQPNLMYDGSASENVANQMQKMWDLGEVNYKTYENMVHTMVNNAIAYEGGVNFLNKLADKEIKIEGFSGTYKQFIGADKWELLLAKADQTQVGLDAKFQEDVSLKLTTAGATDDLVEASNLIKEVEDLVNPRYGNERLNTLRQQIINTKRIIAEKQALQTNAIRKATADQAERNARMINIVHNYDRAIAGENVSLVSKQMGVKEEERIEALKWKIDSIQNSEVLSPEDKAKMLSEYLRVDTDDGPVKALLQGSADRAFAFIQGAYVTGTINTESEMYKDFANLEGLYKAQPNLIAMKFPDIAAQLYSIDYAKQLGLNIGDIVQGKKVQQSLTKEQRAEADLQWKTTVVNDVTMGLSYAPKEVTDAARLVYDRVKAQTGDNESIALKAAGEFVKKSTWKYGADSKTGRYRQDVYGAIPKTFLQVNNTLDSYQTGASIISTKVEDFRKQIGGNIPITVTYESASESVFIRAHNGARLARIYKKDLEYEAQRLAEEHAKKRIREVSDAQKVNKREAKQKEFDAFYNKSVKY